MYSTFLRPSYILPSLRIDGSIVGLFCTEIVTICHEHGEDNVILHPVQFAFWGQYSTQYVQDYRAGLRDNSVFRKIIPRVSRNLGIVLHPSCTGCPIWAGTWVELTWSLIVPSSAKLCLGWRKSGKNGLALGQGGGTLKSKSTQARYPTRWDTLYTFIHFDLKSAATFVFLPSSRTDRREDN